MWIGYGLFDSTRHNMTRSLGAKPFTWGSPLVTHRFPSFPCWIAFDLPLVYIVYILVKVGSIGL
jgi:hypothetical protein